MKLVSVLTALLVQGCALLESHTFTESYSLDPLEFKPAFDAAHQLPTHSCDPAAADACAAAAVDQPSYLGVSCDARTRTCIGVGELRRLQVVDLSSQAGFPADPAEYAVNRVGTHKIPYWVATNTLNVALPAADPVVPPRTPHDTHAPPA